MLHALLPALLVAAPPAFEEASERLGIGGIGASRLAVADLNGDRRPDLVVARERVFLNVADPAAPLGFRFVEAPATLTKPGDDGVATYADLTNDGIPDAIAFRSIDEAKRLEREKAGDTSPYAWLQRGKGDGTFEPPVPIAATSPATACAIGVGDVDRNGTNDLLVGNWYVAYGKRNDAFAADLLLAKVADGNVSFARAPLPEDGVAFDEEKDLGGRPIYGALVAELVPRERAQTPQLLTLAYGRRWNRLYMRTDAGYVDVAPATGIDGDAERNGAYPEGVSREAEKPFRSNGNTFDAAVGDIDGDGRFDLAIAEIAHWWAGPSSDRSRLLVAAPADNVAGTRFEPRAAYSLDRFDPTRHPAWNQGDLFVELHDFDLDGRLDVLLASGDYPDPPPFDERLRLFAQRKDPNENGLLLDDMTKAAGLDHVGCGQIAVADFDGDGRLDVVAGQSFNRFTPEMVAAAGGTPRLRLWLNRTATDAKAIELFLVGDPAQGIATQPYGAIVVLTPKGAAAPTVRQLVGPGGHAGKASEAIVHASLGNAESAEVLVTWPCNPPRTTSHTLAPGRHVIRVPAQGAP
ncbi:MAG: VCBS repeat-containing protein [Phycisphaerae bacterium]|nr:VCBS repeat-containing protein [Phycisphaerae bacterium]